MVYNQVTAAFFAKYTTPLLELPGAGSSRYLVASLDASLVVSRNAFIVASLVPSTTIIIFISLSLSLIAARVCVLLWRVRDCVGDVWGSRNITVQVMRPLSAA